MSYRIAVWLGLLEDTLLHTRNLIGRAVNQRYVALNWHVSTAHDHLLPCS